ncbi:NrsF family protein [Sorangium sp. So ce145]|uniref:NrsF family protein n=1 Tax=Sorangium sp. So ce145 TaxID=3133285 RepID=UPI003F623AA3
MIDEDALKARVLAAAEATPSPTRPEARRRGFAILISSIVLAFAIFEAAGGLEHSAGRPLGLTLATAGGWSLFCAALSWLVLWRGRATLGRSPVVVLLAGLVTPIALTAWTHAFHGTYPEPFARVGWRCLGYTLAMATLPLGSLLTLRRGAEPRSPWALGAAIGAVCGAWAAALVDLWCPLTNLPHVLAGHVVPLGILIAVGALLGRRMLGVRALRTDVARRSDSLDPYVDTKGV